MKLVFRFCFFLFLLSQIFWISARADQLIIEPDMGRNPLIYAIEHANKSIDVVMYGLTDENLLKKLIEQKEKGRKLRIILEGSPYKSQDENSKALLELSRHQIKCVSHIKPFRLIHQKTLIIDHNQAIIMTFNLTHSSFKNERNFGLIVNDPIKVNHIESIFYNDWEHRSFHSSLSDLLVSPDNSRSRLKEIINNATKTIDIYAQNISDYQITGILAKVARKGIRVRLLTSANLREKQKRFLENAGIHIHKSKSLLIHAKVIIIDNQLAILGSINLTKASLDNNRELSVVTEDSEVIKQLHRTFNKDWKAKKK